MTHGDHKQKTTDDGSIYDVQVVHLPNNKLTHALVVNEVMMEKAARLLPIAQKMAESRANRAAFYRASERNLEISGCYDYAQVEESSREAREQAKALFLVARGIAMEDKMVVTVEMWRKIMAFFNQDVTLGSLTIKE